MLNCSHASLSWWTTGDGGFIGAGGGRAGRVDQAGDNQGDPQGYDFRGKGRGGEWRIEPAELFRVYQAIATVDDNQPATGNVDAAAGLQREIAFRDEKIALLQEQIADLRRRLDDSEAERRQTQERLTALLTDQRPRRKWWPWG